MSVRKSGPNSKVKPYHATAASNLNSAPLVLKIPLNVKKSHFAYEVVLMKEPI